MPKPNTLVNKKQPFKTWKEVASSKGLVRKVKHGSAAKNDLNPALEKVWSQTVKTGEILVHFVKGALPGFTLPLKEALQNNPEMGEKFHIPVVAQGRLKSNAFHEKKYVVTRSGGRMSEVPQDFFISFASDPEKNTPENRVEFARVVQRLNHMSCENKYGFANESTVAGDISGDGDSFRCLGDIITVDGVFNVLQTTYADTDLDILIEDDEVMVNYFGKDLMEGARQYYKTGGASEHDEEEKKIADLVANNPLFG